MAIKSTDIVTKLTLHRDQGHRITFLLFWHRTLNRNQHLTDNARNIWTNIFAANDVRNVSFRELSSVVCSVIDFVDKSDHVELRGISS